MSILSSVPNTLTLIRILLAPIMVLVYFVPGTRGQTLAAGIFVLAALTDWLDGFLARFLHQTSRLGAFLDPVADKVIVAIALVLLVNQPELPYLVVPAAIVISREIIVSGLREWMSEMGKRASVAVSYVGKCKAAFQMTAITLLLYSDKTQINVLLLVGYVLLYAAVMLTLWSMVIYIRAAWSEFYDYL